MWSTVLTLTIAILPCTLRANTAWSYYTPPLLYDVGGGDLSAHNGYIPFAPYAPDQPPHQSPSTPPPTTHRPPSTTSTTTTTEFFLPEIIINRNTQQNRAKIAQFGYPPATQPHPVYLPAATTTHVPQTTTRPTHQREPPQPTRQYLPPDETSYDYHYDPPAPVDAVHDHPSNTYLPAALPDQAARLSQSSSGPQLASGSLFAGRHFRNLFTTTFQKPEQFSADPIRLSLNHMSCLVGSTSATDGYFRALLTAQTPQTILTVPVVDPSPTADNRTAFDDDTPDDCGIRLLKSTLIAVDLPARRFAACGVDRCTAADAHHLCLRMRFPQIAGMWTASDAVLTLQCRVQAPIAAQTHAVRLGVQHAQQTETGRASGGGAGGGGTFAHGGTQMAYHTEISLARVRSPAGGVEPLAAGAMVQLGDELVLRAQVKAGDGWNHTRMAEVRLQRLDATGGVLHEATLVDADGCVPTGMRSVCPAGRPVFEAPLGQRLAFRAVMFRGMRSGDEMVLSVRVVGCLRAADCVVVDERCQSTNRAANNVASRRRRRRHLNDGGLYPVADIARLSFRVQMPSASSSKRSHDVDEDATTTHPFGFIAIVATLSLIVLAMIIGLYARKLADK